MPTTSRKYQYVPDATPSAHESIDASRRPARCGCPGLLVAFHAIALAASTASAQMSQTLPVGFDTVAGGSGGTAFPQNDVANNKWQWHYANSNFGPTGPITITEISVRAENGTLSVAGFDFPSFVVACSEATTQYGVATHDAIFANNLGANTVVVRSGPWISGPVPATGGAAATWIPFGLTAPFTFDPTSGHDFVVQIEKCATNAVWGALMDGKIGAPGTVGGNRYGSTTNCAAASSSFSNNEFVPIVRIDYTPRGGVTNYCTAGTTTHGCNAAITADHNPSVSLANPCNVSVSAVEGQKSGIIFYGINNTGFVPGPWASGSTSLLCVKHPSQRTPIQNSGGTFGLCNGALALDWNAYQQAHPSALGNPWSVGSKVYVQAWFRDPLAAKGTNLSNAVEMIFHP
jgi:hypothetical protein